MKKIILIFLLLIILAAGGLFAYISKMDWNMHKERISAQLSEIIDKKIQFTGNLKVNILPHPQLSAEDVLVINPANGEKLAVIKQLDTEVSLQSLLKGKPDIKSLTLDGMEVWFNFDKNGVSNWHGQKKSLSLISAHEFNLHNFTIKKSVIYIKHKKYDVNADLISFNADVQVGSSTGPYRLDGSFLKNNEQYGVALGLDALSQLEDVGVSVVITHPKTESNLRYDGNYNASVDGVKGVFSGQSQKTADFVNALFNEKILENEYNEGMMFSTDISSDNVKTEFSNLVIKFNKLFEGAGNVKISVPQKNKKRNVELKYQLVNFNFQPVKKLIEQKFEQFQKGKKYEPDTKFDLFYDLSAERVLVSDAPTGVLENVSAKGSWKDNSFTLDDFYAACPGNIILNLKASLLEKEGVPYYYFGANVSGQNMLSLINALGIKLKSPKQASYREVDLTFDVHGTPEFMNVEHIDLKMDKAKIEADVAADLRKKEYKIKVVADILNLDNYVFPVKTEENAKLTDVLTAESKRLKWLQNNKAEVSLKAKSATFKGVSARNVEVDFVTDGVGSVVVDKAVAGLLGTDFNVSGNVENLGKNEIRFTDVVYDIKSANVKMLADKLQISIPQWPLFEQKDFNENGTLTGSLQNVYVNSQTKVGEHIFRYDGILSDKDGVMNFDGNMQLKTGHVENLLKLLIGNINGKVYRGALVAKAYVNGNSKKWTAENAEIQMGLDKYSATVDISEEKKNYKIKGEVKTNEFNLLNWINIQKTKTLPKLGTAEINTFINKPDFSGDVINYKSYSALELDIDLNAERSSYGDYVLNNLQTHIINEANNLQFQNLSFDNKNHKVSGNLQINYAQTPAMKGKLLISYPKIDTLGGSVYSLSAKDVVIDADFETSAVTVADMINGLKGKAQVTGKSLLFKGINLDAIGEDLKTREYSKGLYQLVRDNTQSGETQFGEFKIGTLLNGGLITMSPSVLKNDFVNMNVKGNVNLKEWKISEDFTVSYPSLKDVPSYSFTFSGMLNKPTVDIVVEAIANKYDAHWKKVEEEHQKQQAELRQRQAEKIEQLQNKIAEFQENITSTMKIVEDAAAKHFNEDAVAKYQAKTDELNNLNTVMEDMKTQLAGDLIEGKIEEFSAQIDDYKQQISTIPEDVKKYMLEDTEAKNKEMKERENGVYTQVSTLHDEFQNMWNTNRDRLALYNSLEYIDNNEELSNMYFSVQENRAACDGLHSDFDSRSSSVATIEDLNEKHTQIADLEKTIGQEEELLAKMQEAKQNVTDRLTGIVEERRLVYEDEQQRAEAERQKQAEIDAQNLLISNDLNPVIENQEAPVENSVENNENVMTEANSADIATTDNSSAVPQAVAPSPISGKIVTQYDRDKPEPEPEIKPSGGFLTPVDGAVQKATGTISIK